MNWRAGAHLCGVFAFAMVVYCLTMPRTITLEDAGLFQMVCHLDGIAHPPGYPLFTLLCGVLVQTPTVINGNLVSALFGAAAVTVFHAICHELSRDRLFAWVASLAWAFSATFWSQSIIIEVYTLAALMFVVCWWLLLKYVATGSERFWFAACFAYGLSLSNHWPLMILSTAGLMALTSPAMPGLLSSLKSARFTGLTIGCVIAGLLPYTSLVLNRDPAIAVYGGIDSLGELMRYVARSAYDDDHAAAGVIDRLQYAGWLVTESGLQAGVVGLPLILVGFVQSFREFRRSVSLGLLLTWCGSTLVLVLLLNFEYSHYYRAIFRPYPIIAYVAVSFWFALGARTLARLLSRWFSLAPVVIGPLVVATVLLTNYPKLDRSGAAMVENYARTVLESLPRDAVLFVRGDNQVGPVGYLHYVAGVRPDVEVRDLENLVFANRLASPFLPVERQNEVIAQFVRRSERPVFAMDPAISPHIDYGAYVQFNPAGENRYAFPPAFGAWVDLLVEVYREDLSQDPHEQYFVYQSLIRFANHYVGYSVAAVDVPDPIAERTRLLQSTFPGKLVTLDKLLENASRVPPKELLTEMAELTEVQMPAFATPVSVAKFYELFARIDLLPPRNEERARIHLERSFEAFPVSANPAVCLLRNLNGGATTRRLPEADCDET